MTTPGHMTSSLKLRRVVAPDNGEKQANAGFTRRIRIYTQTVDTESNHVFSPAVQVFS